MDTNKYSESWLGNIEAHTADAFVPLDWNAVASQTPIAQQWAIPGLVFRGRFQYVYGKPKSMKSMLMMRAIAAAATGQPFLNYEVAPKKILVLDYENLPREDIYARYSAMGYPPEKVLHNVVYIAQQSIGYLDTTEGSRNLISIVDRHKPDALILDPMSAYTAGPDDHADTINAVRVLSLMPVLRQGVGIGAIDHSGKQQHRGIKGSYQKEAIAHLVWNVERHGDELLVKAETSRVQLERNSYRLRLIEQPFLDFELIEIGGSSRRPRHSSVNDLVDLLEKQFGNRAVRHQEISDFVKTRGIKASSALREEAYSVLITKYGDESLPPRLSRAQSSQRGDSSWGWAWER